jgi:P-type Mg2+ transporter
MKTFSLFSNKAQTQNAKASAVPETYWAIAPEQLMSTLHTTPNGLKQSDTANRIKQYGFNSLKAQRQTSVIGLLLSQFKSPLVLILIFASIISAFVGEWTDAAIVLVP